MPRNGALDNEQWAARVGEVATFADKHGRLPRVADGWIGQWLSQQRSQLSLKKSSMTVERQRVLDELAPGWRERLPSPYPSWDSRAYGLQEFVKQERRMPLSTSEWVYERGLAQWLINQRSAANRGELSAPRVRFLDEHFVGWNAGRREDRWFQRADELAAFVSKHGVLPSPSGGDDERVLAAWLRNQRANAKAGIRMPPERMGYLNSVLPDWQR